MNFETHSEREKNLEARNCLFQAHELFFYLPCSALIESDQKGMSLLSPVMKASGE